MFERPCANRIEGATLTGNAMLLTRASDTISRGQVLSLMAACGMIGAILCLYFGSLRTGLIALVPNVLPVAFYFGVMGATAGTRSV